MNTKEELLIHECNGEFCLTLEVSEPYHDMEMANILDIVYADYIGILNKNNGVSMENKIVYSENDILNSTDTWFKRLEDCQNAIVELKEHMDK